MVYNHYINQNMTTSKNVIAPSTVTTVPVPIKKKRTVAPKVDKGKETVVKEDIPTTGTVKSVRKTRGSKIVTKQQIASSATTPILTNVILNLKCSMSDLKEYNEKLSKMISNPLEYNSSVPPEVKYYDGEKNFGAFIQSTSNRSDKEHHYTKDDNSMVSFLSFPADETDTQEDDANTNFEIQNDIFSRRDLRSVLDAKQKGHELTPFSRENTIDASKEYFANSDVKGVQEFNKRENLLASSSQMCGGSCRENETRSYFKEGENGSSSDNMSLMFDDKTSSIGNTRANELDELLTLNEAVANRPVGITSVNKRNMGTAISILPSVKEEDRRTLFLNAQEESDDVNIKDMSAKLKQLKIQLYKNTLHSEKKSACFWCTYDFDNAPCYIPKYEMDGTIYGYGSFCRPECAVAYLMKETIDDSTKFDRYHLLNQIYSKVYECKKNIKPAPDPHYLLDKFYGNLTIQEYRRLLKTEHLLLVIDKPLTRILPELHEDTDDAFTKIYGIKATSGNSSGVYKVKRQSEQPQGPSKASIIKSTFGI